MTQRVRKAVVGRNAADGLIATINSDVLLFSDWNSCLPGGGVRAISEVATNSAMHGVPRSKSALLVLLIHRDHCACDTSGDGEGENVPPFILKNELGPNTVLLYWAAQCPSAPRSLDK